VKYVLFIKSKLTRPLAIIFSAGANHWTCTPQTNDQMSQLTNWFMRFQT